MHIVKRGVSFSMELLDFHGIVGYGVTTNEQGDKGTRETSHQRSTEE